MLPNTLIVTFSGPEHSGKTTLEAAFAKFMAQYGVSVRMPPDPQREQKMEMPVEELMALFRDKGINIMLMESNTGR